MRYSCVLMGKCRAVARCAMVFFLAVSPALGVPAEDQSGAEEWKRSKPDVVVYLPKGGDAHDEDNEMLLVFEAPKSDELIAMWTQSSVEAYGDNRQMLSRSADGRLLVAMRTMTGHIWYSVSADDGATWRDPEPLRYRDDGPTVDQPIAPCPIFKLNDGRYLLLFHNNDGTLGDASQWKEKWRRNEANYNRRPAFIAVGQFRPDAHQPIWFSQPRQLLDTDGVIAGPKRTAEIATYPSLTEWHGRRTLWYPDRKHYLLGKYITDEMLEQMKVE